MPLPTDKDRAGYEKAEASRQAEIDRRLAAKAERRAADVAARRAAEAQVHRNRLSAKAARAERRGVRVDATVRTSDEAAAAQQVVHSPAPGSLGHLPPEARAAARAARNR